MYYARIYEIQVNSYARFKARMNKEKDNDYADLHPIDPQYHIRLQNPSPLKRKYSRVLSTSTLGHVQHKARRSMILKLTEVAMVLAHSQTSRTRASRFQESRA
jgi:hypothetical protein